jgi:hypothetical protein
MSSRGIGTRRNTESSPSGESREIKMRLEHKDRILENDNPLLRVVDPLLNVDAECHLLPRLMS